MTRRTLKYIDRYPAAEELYNRIVDSPGWPYKTDFEFYRRRDKALVSLLYLIAPRISEALRLKKDQFSKAKKRIEIQSILLSKTIKGRHERYREVAYLPLRGKRKKFTELIMRHVDTLGPEAYIFATVHGRPIGRIRAWQIVNTITGIPCHWLRAFGEDYLYQAWDNDLLAVAHYVKVNTATLGEYMRRRFTRYEAV